MKHLLAIMAPILILAGCGITPEGQAAREAISSYSAKIADGELLNLEWAICNAVSIGAVKRRYGTVQAKADAYKTFCTVQIPMPDISK